MFFDKGLKPVNEYSKLKGIVPIIVIFLLVGGLFFLIAIMQYASYLMLKSAAVKAEGFISDISRTGSGKSRKTRFMITFADENGANHTVFADYASPFTSVGEKVQVMYFPGKPQTAQVASAGAHFVRILLILFSLPFILISWFFISKLRKAKKELEHLSFLGIRQPVPVRGYENGNFSINKRPTYRLVLDRQHESRGFYRSELIMFNPEKYITGKNAVLIYDPVDPAKYFLDYSEIENAYNSNAKNFNIFSKLFGS